MFIGPSPAEKYLLIKSEYPRKKTVGWICSPRNMADIPAISSSSSAPFASAPNKESRPLVSRET